MSGPLVHTQSPSARIRQMLSRLSVTRAFGSVGSSGVGLANSRRVCCMAFTDSRLMLAAHPLVDRKASTSRSTCSRSSGSITTRGRTLLGNLSLDHGTPCESIQPSGLFSRRRASRPLAVTPTSPCFHRLSAIIHSRAPGLQELQVFFPQAHIRRHPHAAQ